MKPSTYPSQEPPLVYRKSRYVATGDHCSNCRITHADARSFNQTTENDSLKKLLQEIRDLLKMRVHNEEEQSHEADKKDEIKKDWMLAAAVLDRICAIVFAVIFIGGYVIFLILFITRP